MSISEKTLKSEYSSKLYFFIAFNFLIAWSVIIFGKIEFNNITVFLKEAVSQESLIGIFLPITTIVINGLLSSNIKAKLVFWKIKNPLPGSIAFSKLSHSDARISIKSLESRNGVLPTDPQEQNRLWYNIYKKHDNKPIIHEVHRNFLFTRDMSSIAFLFAVLWLFAMPFLHIEILAKSLLWLVYVLEYFLTMIAARNYGHRFVCNVLAEESV